jgi:hypothetical protein
MFVKHHAVDHRKQMVDSPENPAPGLKLLAKLGRVHTRFTFEERKRVPRQAGTQAGKRSRGFRPCMEVEGSVVLAACRRQGVESSIERNVTRQRHSADDAVIFRAWAPRLLATCVRGMEGKGLFIHCYYTSVTLSNCLVAAPSTIAASSSGLLATCKRNMFVP